MNLTTQNTGDLALLCNLRNIRICMGKIKCVCNLSSAVCVSSFLCGPQAELWPFYRFY